MHLLVLIILLGACVVLMLLERAGAPTTLALTFKGDLKRETRWLAQYGQGACTLVAVLIVWQLDEARRRYVVAMVVAVFGVAIVAMLIKRLVGRVRPGRENAGKFLGITLRHANYRESFPSSHSASAIALSVFLAMMYPPAATVFWGLGIVCAVLRYLMDAHWPSDVLGGVALGYAAAHLTWRAFALT